MLRNYIKTAWRNLVKNKFYTVLNVFGLSIGLAVGLLILLYVQDEHSYDRFNKNASHLYKLENMVGTGSSKQLWQVTVAPIGKLAKQQLVDIKDAVRVNRNYIYGLFSYGDKSFTEPGCVFTDASLFTVFDFPIIKGNKENPFADINSVVLTESTAKKYFGDEEAIGKIIVADENTNFTVSGIVKDFPENSSLQFDIMLPMSLLGKIKYSNNEGGRNLDNDFGQFNYATYLLLQEGTDVKELPAKLEKIHLANKPDDTDLSYLLHPLTKMHLYNSDGSAGSIETVRMFTIIALLILVIACINYVNLATSRAILRAKEVSMRKIAGAGRLQLFGQFITETVVLFILATLLAVGFMQLLLPLYNSITGKQLTLDLWDYNIRVTAGLTLLGTVILSSIYPALLLSSFHPLKALKGKITGRFSEAFFRKALVVTQFIVSVTLITGTIVIGKQLKYIREKNLGYDKEQVFSFWMRDIQNHYDAVKADLLQQPGIEHITRSNSNIIQLSNQTGDTEWDGKKEGETFMVYPVSVDKDFIPFFNMQVTKGANFTGALTDSSHFILNEAAVSVLGMKDPVGKHFKMWENDGTIIGVVKDFHFASMKEKIEPAVLFYNPQNTGRMYIKTTTQHAQAAIRAARQQYEKYNAGYPFTYAFLDDTFNNLYKTEQKTGILFNLFAAIAILISCLGLFGLSTYTAQVRTREIGVRKVLGASVTGITRLLAFDFIKLVLIAIVVAIPLSWYIMHSWLQDFAYRVELNGWIFLIAGIIAVVIALLTISVQSVKAALANPVKSLRTE